MSFLLNPAFLSTSDCNYNNLLRIFSKAELLTFDAGTQQCGYFPFSESGFHYLSRQASSLKQRIEYVADEIRSVFIEHVSIRQLTTAYENLGNYLYGFIDCLHWVHKSMYVSIYYNWADKVSALFHDLLEPVINQFLTLADATDQLSITNIHCLLRYIVRAFREIAEIDTFRTADEIGLIFFFIKDQYKETHGASDQILFANQKDDYFDLRLLPCDANGLRCMLDQNEHEMTASRLGKAFHENRHSPVLAVALCRLGCSEDEFNDLFQKENFSEYLRTHIYGLDHQKQNKQKKSILTAKALSNIDLIKGQITSMFEKEELAGNNRLTFLMIALRDLELIDRDLLSAENFVSLLKDWNFRVCDPSVIRKKMKQLPENGKSHYITWEKIPWAKPYFTECSYFAASFSMIL